MYNAADCLLAPSQGEGFCVPLIESAACGTPAIACDFAAQAETHLAGWRIAIDKGAAYGEKVWISEMVSFRFRPSRAAILAHMEAAYAHRHDTQYADAAIRKAQDYRLDHVMAEWWLPLFEKVEDELLKGEL
jgi:glycosyltransferase involved in cell wall biosynthesis